MAASPNAFGPYTLSARLGSGATSTVFLASHPDIPHPIALKLLSSKVTSDADWLARFQREALVMQRLQHRNIVAYHEFGQIDGRWFIAMEHVQGHSLRSVVGQSLKPALILRLGAQLASGLASAHAKGLIHRDIKPENIVLTREGIAKILDFGLARPIAADSAEDWPAHLADVTRTGFVMGTPRYMSPEQSRGEPLTPATDIFSLALCLFEVTTGRHAFPSPFLKEVIGAICDTPAPSITRWRSDLPVGFAALLDQMLAKLPARRPASEAVFEQLRSLVQNG